MRAMLLDKEFNRQHKADMPKLRPLSAKEVCGILQNHDFVKLRQAGSHIVMRLDLKDDTSRTVIVPNHTEIAKGTLASIIKQSGLEAALFRR